MLEGGLWSGLKIQEWLENIRQKKSSEQLYSKELNLEICSTEDEWIPYFEAAERDMDGQWNGIIWPLIKDFTFTSVLELAPGAGRNTVKLAQYAEIIHAVDLNEYVLEQLRDRFQNYKGDCVLHIHKNDGTRLDMIPDNSITLVYSWDAVVHFDKAVIFDYIKEFSRILKVGGKGFIHHSNLGSRASDDIRSNPHWRSNMSKELFVEYCEDSGLTVIDQVDMPWDKIKDCITIFEKHQLS